MLAYLTFRNVFWGAIIAAATSALASYVFTHFKWISRFGDTVSGICFERFISTNYG